MAKEIRACPFCGDRHIEVMARSSWFECHCLCCGAKGPGGNDHESAIERWNWRHMRAIEAMRASSAGGEVVERLSAAFGMPIHIEPRDFLEKILASMFGRQPDMSGDQRKRLVGEELEAVQDTAAKLLAALQSQPPSNEARLRESLLQAAGRLVQLGEDTSFIKAALSNEGNG